MGGKLMESSLSEIEDGWGGGRLLRWVSTETGEI